MQSQYKLISQDEIRNPLSPELEDDSEICNPIVTTEYYSLDEISVLSSDPNVSEDMTEG